MAASNEQKIIDRSDLRKWRTELPNLYDDSDLEPYGFRLLTHYKRVGRCTEGLERTARRCHMSQAQVSATRRALAERGWLQLREIETRNGIGYEVVITDIWEVNFSTYSKHKPGDQLPEDWNPRSAGLLPPNWKPIIALSEVPIYGVPDPSGSEGSSADPSGDEVKASGGEGDPSGGEVKNKPYKNQPEESSSGAVAPVETPALSEAASEFFKQFNRKRWATEAQREKFADAESKVGAKTMIEVIRWAATMGISDVNRIHTAALNWGKRKNGGANGKHHADPTTNQPSSDQLARDIELRAKRDAATRPNA